MESIWLLLEEGGGAHMCLLVVEVQEECLPEVGFQLQHKHILLPWALQAPAEVLLQWERMEGTLFLALLQHLVVVMVVEMEHPMEI
jgi:hypothetical protein